MVPTRRSWLQVSEVRGRRCLAPETAALTATFFVCLFGVIRNIERHVGANDI
jgi:hypothetical protein